MLKHVLLGLKYTTIGLISFIVVVIGQHIHAKKTYNAIIVPITAEVALKLMGRPDSLETSTKDENGKRSYWIYRHMPGRFILVVEDDIVVHKHHDFSW